MKTIFGVEWPVAGPFEIFIIISFFVFIAVVFTLVGIYYKSKAKTTDEEQFFFFKTQQMGLTHFQAKILKSIMDKVSVKDIQRMMDSPELFESSIGSSLKFITGKGETSDSLLAIARDIIIIYEKIYHRTHFQKALDSMREIEPGRLLYFYSEDNRVFIGKISDVTDKTIRMGLFRTFRTAEGLPDLKVHVFLWRNGDAEYTFETKVVNAANNIVEIAIPEVWIRGKEVRHPYIDVVTPCTIITADESKKRGEAKAAAEGGTEIEEKGSGAEPETESIPGSIYKLNEYELVARLNQTLDFDRNYEIDFMINEFLISATGVLLADKSVHEEHLHYYTFKITDMSPVAKKVLKEFVLEQLQ